MIFQHLQSLGELARTQLQAALPLVAALIVVRLGRRRISAAQAHSALLVGIVVAPFASGLASLLPGAGLLPPRPSSSATSVAGAALSWAGTLWVLGAALVLLHLAAGLRALHQIERSAMAPPGELAALFRELSRRIGFADRARLLLCHAERMPMSWGSARPRVLLPRSALRWSATEQRAVIAHELAHLQRRDFAAKLLARLSLAWLWCNPLAWWVHRRLLQEQERAADALALRTPIAPTDYARCLLAIAHRHQPARSTEPGLAMSHGTAALEHRLRSVLAGQQSARRAGWAPRILPIVAALAAASMLQQENGFGMRTAHPADEPKVIAEQPRGGSGTEARAEFVEEHDAGRTSRRTR